MTFYEIIDDSILLVHNTNGLSSSDIDYRWSSNINTIIFSEGITRIDGIWRDFERLQKVVLPESLLRIGDDAFSNCPNLTTINFPDRLLLIGNDTFENTKLKEVILPDTVLQVGHGSFHNCYHLQKIKLSNALTTIEYDCFSDHCADTIVIPPSVQVIEARAFDCDHIMNVTIPKTVKKVHKSAFINHSGVRLEDDKVTEIYTDLDYYDWD